MSATSADFTKWAANAKTLSVDSLLYVISDCRQAAAAMAGWNEDRENFYRDQSMTYGDELRRRQGGR